MLLPILITLTASVPDAAACAQLFGDDAAHARNRDRRKEVLQFVDVSPYAISVVHSDHWDEPEPISFAGLRLLETDTQQHPRRAIVEVGAELDAFGCAEGRYAIEKDDAIGPDTRVLAILDGIVLVEHHDNIRYLFSDGVVAPIFSMVWSSPWPMNPYLPRRNSGIASTPVKTAGKRR